MDKYYPQRTILWHLNVFLVRWDMLKLIFDKLRKVTKKLFGLPIHHWLITTKFVRLLLINTIPKNYFVTLEVFLGTSRHALVKIYSGTYAQIFYNIWLGEFVGFKWVKIHSNCLKKKCLDIIIWYIILNGNLLFCICSGKINGTESFSSCQELPRWEEGDEWASLWLVYWVHQPSVLQPVHQPDYVGAESAREDEPGLQVRLPKVWCLQEKSRSPWPLFGPSAETRGAVCLPLVRGPEK